MDLTSDRGLQLLAFSAVPGSPSHDGLRLLATWAATQQIDPVTADTTTSPLAGRSIGSKPSPA